MGRRNKRRGVNGGKSTNILEGQHPDEMKTGETYRLVYKGKTRIGEVRLGLKRVTK